MIMYMRLWGFCTCFPRYIFSVNVEFHLTFDFVNSKSDVGATGISGLFCLLRWHPGVSGAVFEHAHKSYVIQQMF